MIEKTVRLLDGRRLMKMMGMNLSSKEKVIECIYPESYTKNIIEFEFLESWLDRVLL